MDQLNVAVIGCGSHARSHFRMIADEPRLRLAAIAEPHGFMVAGRRENRIGRQRLPGFQRHALGVTVGHHDPSHAAVHTQLAAASAELLKRITNCVKSMSCSSALP